MIILGKMTRGETGEKVRREEGMPYLQNSIVENRNKNSNNNKRKIINAFSSMSLKKHNSSMKF